MLDYHLCLTLTSLLLCLLIFIRSVVLRRRANTHAHLLAEQKVFLQRYEEELTQQEQESEREIEFHTSLQQAEVTTELQQSRISFHKNRNQLKAPERYAYVRSMFYSGMQIEEISSALGMSCHEITQLIKLSTIAQQTNPFSQMEKG